MKKERYTGKLRSYDNQFKYYFRGNGFTLYTNDFDTFYLSENDYIALKNRIECIEKYREFFTYLDYTNTNRAFKEMLLLPESLLTDDILSGPLEKTLLSHISSFPSLNYNNKNSINFYNSFLMKNGFPFFYFLDLDGRTSYLLWQRNEPEEMFNFINMDFDENTGKMNVIEKEEITSFPFNEYKTTDSLSYFYINFYPNIIPITSFDLSLFNKIKDDFNNKDYLSIFSNKIKGGKQIKEYINTYIYSKCCDLTENFAVYKNRYDKLETYEYPKLEFKTITNNTTTYFKDESTRYVGLLFDMYCFDKVYSFNKDENYKYIERYDLETFYIPSNQIENLKFAFKSVQRIFRNFNKPVIAENFIKMIGLPYYALFYCQYFNFLDGSEDDFIKLFNYKDIEDDYLRSDCYIFSTGFDAKDESFDIVLFSRYMLSNGVYITCFNNNLCCPGDDSQVYILFNKNRIKDDFIKLVDGDFKYINTLVDVDCKHNKENKPTLEDLFSQLVEALSSNDNNVDVLSDPSIFTNTKDYSLIKKKSVLENTNHKIKDLFSFLNEGVYLKNALNQIDFTVQERNIFSNYFDEIMKTYSEKTIVNIKKKLKKKEKNDLLINSLTFQTEDKEIKFFFSKKFYIFKIGKNYYVDEIINNYLSKIDEKEKESFTEYINNKNKIKVYKHFKNNSLFYLIDYLGFSNDYVYKKYLVFLFKNYALSSFKGDYIYDNLTKFYSEVELLTPFIKLENEQYNNLDSTDIKNIFEFDYISNYLFNNNDCILYYDYKEFKKERFYIARGRIFNAFSVDMKTFYFDKDDKDLIKKAFEYVIASNGKIKSKEEFILSLGLPSYFYSYLMKYDLSKLSSDEFIKLLRFDKVLAYKFKKIAGEDICFRLNGIQNYLIYEKRNTQYDFLTKGILLKSNRNKPLTYLLDKGNLNYDDIIVDSLIETLNERILTIDIKNKNIINEFKNLNPELYFKFINFIQDKDNLYLTKYNQVLLHDFVTLTLNEDKDMYLNIISSLLSKKHNQDNIIIVINKYLPNKFKINEDNKKIETYEEIILFIIDMIIKYIVKNEKHNLYICY